MGIKKYFENAVRTILGAGVNVSDDLEANISIEVDTPDIVEIRLKKPFSGNFNILGFLRNLEEFMEHNMTSEVAQVVMAIEVSTGISGPAAKLNEQEAPKDDQYAQEPTPAGVASSSDLEDSAEEADDNDDDED